MHSCCWNHEECLLPGPRVVSPAGRAWQWISLCLAWQLALGSFVEVIVRWCYQQQVIEMGLMNYLIPFNSWVFKNWIKKIRWWGGKHNSSLFLISTWKLFSSLHKWWWTREVLHVSESEAPMGAFPIRQPCPEHWELFTQDFRGYWFLSTSLFLRLGWAGLSPSLTLPSAPLSPFSEHLLPGRALSWSSSVALAQALVARTWHLHLPHLEVYDVCSNTHVASPSFANSGKGRCGHGTCHLFWALPAGPMRCACRNSEHKDGGLSSRILWSCFWISGSVFKTQWFGVTLKGFALGWFFSFFPFWRNWSNSRRI